MSKRNKIIYWIATLWLCLGMVSTALTQIFASGSEGAFTNGLGYPDYFVKLIACWKLAGVVVLLIPRLPGIKEWAYAGFFFLTTGAMYSHIATGQPLSQIFPALLLLVLTVISWAFRPAKYKPASHSA